MTRAEFKKGYPDGPPNAAELVFGTLEVRKLWVFCSEECRGTFIHVGRLFGPKGWSRGNHPWSRVRRNQKCDCCEQPLFDKPAEKSGWPFSAARL